MADSSSRHQCPSDFPVEEVFCKRFMETCLWAPPIWGNGGSDAFREGFVSIQDRPSDGKKR